VVLAKLSQFIESGLTIVVGTRDAELLPNCARGMGLRLEPELERATLFLPCESSEAAVANLRAGSPLAISLSRPADYRTVQLKGRAVSLRQPIEAERAFVEAYHAALVQELRLVGIPVEASRRLEAWPCHAVEVELEELFEQTPGPLAGSRLG
jgi:hypothetical protein